MAFYSWNQIQDSVISPHYSTAKGPRIKGLKIEIIPPNTEHEVWTVDGEAEILSCKDVVAG